MSTIKGNKMQKKDIKRDKFLPEEDEMIINAVEQYGLHNWGKIADLFDGRRNSRQIRERWQSYLDRRLKVDFTEEEDALLRQLYEQYGPKWAEISRMMNNKSGILCRNRYRHITTQKRHKSKVELSKVRESPIPSPAPSPITGTFSIFTTTAAEQHLLFNQSIEDELFDQNEFADLFGLMNEDEFPFV